jgi:integrase/recombinase XerD
MAYSITVLLKRNKETKDGIPLYIRITASRRSQFIALPIRVRLEDWDEEKRRLKKSYPNSARANAVIAKKLAEAEQIALDLTLHNKVVGSQKIKSKLQGGNATEFYPFFERIVQSMEKKGQISTSKRYKVVLEKLKLYAKNRIVYLQDIDLAFLNGFQEFLITRYGNSTNTIHSNFRVIRKVINDAVNEDLISLVDNPFRKFKFKLEKTKTEYITDDELKKIENLELPPSSAIFHHRNIYVFSCYAAGLRISDVLLLKWCNLDENHVNIKVKKTGEQHRILLPNKAIEILSYYRDKSSNAKKSTEFVFPLINLHSEECDPLKIHNAISRATAYTNKSLKEIAKRAEIDKKLHFHTSRHSFAIRALQKGIRIEYVSKMLSHATLKQTQHYAKIMNEELDKAMEVFNQ